MAEILGNTKGLKSSVLEALQGIYDLKVDPGQVVSTEIAVQMADISEYLNKEISLYITRAGQILNIAVGSADTVQLPDFNGKRGAARLSGVRCVHTHPGGNSALSGVDYSALKSNRFDAMVTIGVNSPDFQKSVVSIGMLTGLDANKEFTCSEFGPLSLAQTENFYFPNIVNTLEKILEKEIKGTELIAKQERAMLVSLEWGNTKAAWSAEDSLEELKQLTDTAGAVTLGKFFQSRPKPDPAFFIGRGKVGELALFAQQEGIDLCIFDDELSPAQQRNLEATIGVRILDRTGLILDIFAQRARTNEGKMQVELAQLKYTLPRIGGQGLSLSRLGGGIGTRGPGETKLEVDKRRIRDRIAFIEDNIKKIKSVRDLHRNKRSKQQIPAISLVGYTNAGKSTLLNTLTQSDIYAQDQLFATLDPTTRKLLLPDKREALLTDTVGFIQRLPHQLVAAFKSTLEEVCQADLLLHVIDVSHELYKEQTSAVYEVLKEIGAADKEVITVYNKVDNLPPESELLRRLSKEENAVCISAKQGQGLEELKQLIVDNLKLQSIEAELLFPYNNSAIAAQMHENSTVLQQEYLADGIRLKVRISCDLLPQYEKYLLKQ